MLWKGLKDALKLFALFFVAETTKATDFLLCDKARL
jgi:hypothetical protein